MASLPTSLSLLGPIGQSEECRGHGLVLTLFGTLPGGAAAGTLKGAAGLIGSPAQTSAPPFWAPQRGVSLPLPSPNRVSTGGFILGGALLRAVPAPRGVSSLVEW